MDLIRIEYDFGNVDGLSEKLTKIITIGTSMIESKLDIGIDRDIELGRDYKLQAKFFSRLKEKGVAVVYKDKLTLNIYPTMVCLTVAFKDMEAFEMASLRSVETSLRDAVLNKYIPIILDDVAKISKGV